MLENALNFRRLTVQYCLKAIAQRPIAPVAVRPVEDRASLALQFGFFVSGDNPIFGTHHFYPMLSTNGEVGFDGPMADHGPNAPHAPAARSADRRSSEYVAMPEPVSETTRTT